MTPQLWLGGGDVRDGQVIDSFEPHQKGFPAWLAAWSARFHAGEQIAVLVDTQTGHAVVIERLRSVRPTSERQARA